MRLFPLGARIILDGPLRPLTSSLCTLFLWGNRRGEVAVWDFQKVNERTVHAQATKALVQQAR